MSVDGGRKAMLMRLMVLEFAAIEFNLYLDTHPRDEGALAEYARVSHELMMLKHEYEMAHGPLVNFGHAHLPENPTAWNWLCEPWPWELTF